MNDRPFAIYLNANARHVSPEVVSRIEELVHPEDIFFAATRDDADRFARVILERGYPTVFTGGGDGTVVGLINALRKVAGPDGAAIPTLGVLSLGTGNALSRLVSSAGALSDLKAYVTNPSRDVWTISLMEHEGALHPFGSLGADAEMMADYHRLKDTVGAGRLKPLFQNVTGYFAAFFAATLPRHVGQALRGERLEVRITNLGESAYRIGPEGRKTRFFGPGEILYEGPVVLTILGTVPVFGYGLRLLPWAERDPDMMQLRMSNIPVAASLVHLPAAWNGTLQHEQLQDFYVQRVRIKYSRPMPFQLSGDFEGMRDTVEVAVRPRAVRLLRFI
jgi:diacylglycerol kinase family enzyme